MLLRGRRIPNGRHRHRITRRQRENRSDALRLTILAFSGADGSCASPLYARVSRIFAENASNMRLVGGAKRIRTIGTDCLTL
jgi:hypothetical protein